jgi:putative ATPase
MKVMSIIRKDLKTILSDKKALAIIIAMPLIIMIILSSALRGIFDGTGGWSIDRLNIAIVRQYDKNEDSLRFDKALKEGILARGIGKEAAEELRAAAYEKKGENHYDTISAFIKSMRGSDPDAVLHYLAKMLYAGEDPKFIARRIMICASEDVGNADPNALVVATAAANAVHMIGMPEAQIILSQAALYVACAPKSNSAVVGIGRAIKDVESKKTGTVPLHLRNDAFKGARDWGYGIEYKYPHDYEGNYVDQQYLPDEIIDAQYYFPSDNGYERKMKELPKLKNRKSNVRHENQ